jgi:DNA polymerase-3 subunit beta
MKFRLRRDEFADAVAWTAKTIPTRLLAPVLAGIRLEAAEERLEISSFDYEVSSRVNVDVQIAEPGTAVVAGRLLAEITKALPNKPVDVELVGEVVELTCGTAQFTLPTLPLEDYPTLPALPSVVGVVKAPDFATAVGRVTIAAGRDDTLPMLTGVRVEMTGDRVTMFCTDRYRLAMTDLAWRPERPDVDLNTLIPARALSDVAKSLSASGGDLSLHLDAAEDDKALAGFSGDGRRTTTRILSGAFPNVRTIFPTTETSRLVVSTRELTEVVRRVSLVADRVTPLRLHLSEDDLMIEAGGQGSARARESIAATVTGEPMATALNPQFLFDGLNAISTPNLILTFVSPNKPVMIRPADDDGEIVPGFKYVVMTVRIP